MKIIIAKTKKRNGIQVFDKFYPFHQHTNAASESGGSCSANNVFSLTKLANSDKVAHLNNLYISTMKSVALFKERIHQNLNKEEISTYYNDSKNLLNTLKNEIEHNKDFVPVEFYFQIDEKYVMLIRIFKELIEDFNSKNKQVKVAFHSELKETTLQKWQRLLQNIYEEISYVSSNFEAQSKVNMLDSHNPDMLLVDGHLVQYQGNISRFLQEDGNTFVNAWAIIYKKWLEEKIKSYSLKQEYEQIPQGIKRTLKEDTKLK